MVQVEAGAAKDELKRLRKEMLRLKHEWTTLKALYESAKVHNHAFAGQSNVLQRDLDKILCPDLLPL